MGTRPRPGPRAPMGSWEPGLRVLAGGALALALAVAGCAAGAPARPAVGRARHPIPVASSATGLRLSRAQGVEAPPGFRVQVEASGLGHPTAMAYGPDGRLYVAESSGAIVVAVPGSRRPLDFAAGFPSPQGLVWLGHTLYVAAQGQVDRVVLVRGRAARRVRVIGGLPHGLHHQNALIRGPDGRLLIASGSTCNLCREPTANAAAVLSLLPSGRGLRRVATGLADPVGLAVQPGTGRLYATVDGQAGLGSMANPEPADMLVRVLPGGWYGWPGCWPDARLLVMQGSCRGVTTPAAFLGPHAGAAGIAFYTGTSFPPGYRGNLFVAEWGEARSTAGPGRRVARIVLGRDGTAAISDVSVFAQGLAHPIAVLVDPRGALLVLDWGRGVIYRIQADAAP